MARRPLIDLQHRFFIPLWRRIAVVAVCIGWGAFEFSGGFAFWGTLFMGVGLYCAYVFFLAFDPPDEEEKDG